MTPDRAIVKKIKSLSKDLHVFWNPGWERWEIWEQGKSGGWYLVIRVTGPEGEYRPLDERAYVLLCMCDLQNSPYTSWMDLKNLHDINSAAYEDKVLQDAYNETEQRYHDYKGDRVLRDGYSVSRSSKLRR